MTKFAQFFHQKFHQRVNVKRSKCYPSTRQLFNIRLHCVYLHSYLQQASKYVKLFQRISQKRGGGKVAPCSSQLCRNLKNLQRNPRNNAAKIDREQSSFCAEIVHARANALVMQSGWRLCRSRNGIALTLLSLTKRLCLLLQRKIKSLQSTD